MGLTSDVVSNMLNGVSRQPPAIRASSQCEEQINFDSSLTDGLTRRPPAKTLGTFPASAEFKSKDPFTHTVERGPEEAYQIILDGAGFRIVSLLTGLTQYIQTDAGVAETATHPYLTTADAPRKVFKAVTVADSTFIVNRQEVIVGSVETVASSMIQYQRFSDLPTTGAAATTYRINGADSTLFSAYYVRWDGFNYVETVHPTEGLSLINGPMEVKIVGTQDDKKIFSVTQIVLDGKAVGDNLNNPPPGFVGKTLEDIVFFRDRLGFMTRDSIAFSRAGKYFNFWRRTMTAVLDDDPIDTLVSHTRSFSLSHAIPFGRSVYLFGTTTQFEFTSGDVLSPRAFRCDPVTEFDCDPFVRPIIVGNNLYFVDTKGQDTRVNEYFIDSDSLRTDATDITSHCVGYLKGRPKSLAGSAKLNAITVVTDYQSSVDFYVYKFKFAENGQRVQSSWSKYQLGGQIKAPRHASFIGSAMLLLTEQTTTAELLTIPYAEVPFGEAIDSDGNWWDLHLDRKEYGIFSTETSDESVGVIKQDAQDIELRVFVESFSGRWSDISAAVNRGDDNTIRVPNSYSGKGFIVGHLYPSVYRMSPIFLRDQDGAAVMQGRLQLKRLHLNLKKTGDLAIVYTPLRRVPVVREFRPSSVGVGKIGSVTLANDQTVKLAVRGNAETTAIELSTGKHYPASIVSYEWVGNYEKIPQ